MSSLFKITIVFFLFAAQPLFSQSLLENYFCTEKDSTYYAKYNKLKELYLVKLQSAGHANYMELSRAYDSKWRSVYDGPHRDLGTDTGGLKWLSKNWQRTAFTSYEEAEHEFQKVFDAYKESDKQNPEYSRFSVETVMYAGPQLYIDLQMELMQEYPHLFR